MEDSNAAVVIDELQSNEEQANGLNKGWMNELGGIYIGLCTTKQLINSGCLPGTEVKPGNSKEEVELAGSDLKMANTN